MERVGNKETIREQSVNPLGLSAAGIMRVAATQREVYMVDHQHLGPQPEPTRHYQERVEDYNG